MSPSRPSRLFRQDSERGSVILITLCFVAVLAIMLAGYIAVCNRAMQLSNRSFQAELSRQLAEAGIDEALRAFNKNDWSDWTSAGITADWTLDATNKRARASLTFPATKFGQGATATVKLRVDNYDADTLGSAWSSGVNYRTNNLVGYNGSWYRCVLQHSGQTPSTTSAYWIQEQSPINFSWKNSSSYVAGDMIYKDNTWYRCTSDHPSPDSWTDTNWSPIGPIKLYSYSDPHSAGDIFYYPNTTTWYYVYNSGTPGSYTTATYSLLAWKWNNSKPYKAGDFVYYYASGVGRWYSCTTAHSNQTPSTSSLYWADSQSSSVMAATTALFNWNSSSVNYSRGDVVYYSSTSNWYRCILNHTSSPSVSPTNTTYWTNTPILSTNWDSGKQYTANDLVSYNGIWYLSLSSSNNYGQNPTDSSSSYWIGSDTSNTAYQWNSTTSYAANSYRCYGGAWYKCLLANTGQSPNNTTYWTPTWAQSSGVSTGAPVVYAEATVTLGDGTKSRTQLRAPIAPASLFPNAAGANTTLSIGGSGGTVDSYDSITDPTASTRTYSSVLAAGATTGTAISIAGTTTIKGYVAAPSDSSTPYAPLASFGGSTTVKSSGSPLSPNVDLSQVSRSPVIPNFDPKPTPLSSAFSSWDFPYGNNLASILSTTTDIGIPGATTPVRYYYNGSLTVRFGSTPQTININGPVILYINGTLRIRSGGVININSTGSAEIHVDGGIREDSGTEGFNNLTFDPKKLILISDVTSTTSHRLESTTNPLYAVVYIPNTTSTSGLDIRNGKEIFGAVSANRVNFRDAANLHYDTSLRSAAIPGVDQPYTVTQWQELDITNAATMP